MEASGAKNMEELMAISGDEWLRIDAEKHIADECCYVVVDGDVIPEDLTRIESDEHRRDEESAQTRGRMGRRSPASRVPHMSAGDMAYCYQSRSA